MPPPDDLGKHGKAFVTVNLVPYASDTDFEKNPPSCRVAVEACHPDDSTKIIQTGTTDIPTTVAPYMHQFTIKVQSKVNSFGRYIGFPRYRSLNIQITTKPINGFEEWYETDESIQGLTIKAGCNEQRNVALKPKRTGSRLNQSVGLDKPSLRNPKFSI